ncbi:ATP-binding protein [Vibrio nitrifigilis]|uniref:histidine kinase n=1 Tax=Vibrio nitrifigilis TaxID=2789781 RepID=A0ABS0GDP6_9VIBR|nr:ATP-binding protein [Vibrio nitrifigilis]MBF9000492.1 response regulator [Vibrio nitrifigilis]
MNSDQAELLKETLLELERSKEREHQLAEENRVILAALSALSNADNKYQIFEELKRVLGRYIEFDDFIVISKSKHCSSYYTFLTSNPAFQGKQWRNTPKFQRVLSGEGIVLFEPNEQDEFHHLSSSLKKQINSVLMTGISAEASNSVLLLIGKRKGQFSLETKATLLRFRPLLERAISDIEYKEELQQLVNIKTRELSIAQQQAEQANKSKSQFLAMMSHELRTPLNAVLGLIDVLRQDISKEQRDLLEQMENSAELLLIIINDILDLSRIESGHFKLQCNWIDLEKKLGNSLSYHKQLAQEKGINFTVTHQLCHENVYWLDSTRLMQILFNVVGNAIKFTKKGNVTVDLRTVSDSLMITVKDTGIGIDDDRIEQLFSPFIQADNSITRTYGGTGLGLTITKHLVELMNGKISVESKVNQGSTFTIMLPLKSKVSSRESNRFDLIDEQSSEKNHAKQILVVEDTKTNQMVIKLILNRLGYTVTLADNGQDAIKLLNHDKQFDLVFMDVSMPIMDGIEATKQIRLKGLNVPIIALTAHTMDQDKNDCLKSGMNDFVMKPIRTKDLSGVLSKFIPGN